MVGGYTLATGFALAGRGWGWREDLGDGGDWRRGDLKSPFLWAILSVGFRGGRDVILVRDVNEAFGGEEGLVEEVGEGDVD